MINDFRGKYRFLSNFYTAPLWYENLEYASSENAYQASKTLDHNIRKQFQWIKASEAKQKGKLVLLWPAFEFFKLDIMERIVKSKFNTHAYLRRWLFDTGDEELQEGNWWGDTFWGTVNGVGDNHLGKILMRIRSDIRYQVKV